MGLRNNDMIAHEFQRLIGQSKKQKIAQTQATHNSSIVKKATTEDITSSVSDLSDDDLADLLIHEADDDENIHETSLDDAIEEHTSSSEDLSLDSKAHEIMIGLEKVSASLINKGEVFAADVVNVAAAGIKDDLLKEALRKREIISTLTKMASNFQDAGDFFASDLVKATINKIT